MTWEQMTTIRKDDLIKLSIYARNRKLDYQDGWRWARKILKNNKKFSRTVKLLKGQIKHGPKYKFGICVPRNIKEALMLEKMTGTTFWKDAMQTKIQQLLQFKTFKILKRDM